MIDVQHAHVRLGDRLILEDITFSLEQGDFLAVLGPNGGGKSTLVKALLGTVELSSGSIQTAPGNGRKRAGYVPQIKNMDRTFPAESIELVATSETGKWPWRVSGSLRERCLKALQSAGAEHVATRPLRTLSGGELQRVYLARAILGDPALLLLDEPEAGVDAAGTSTLFDLVDTLAENSNTTIVMVTHDWDVALHHASHVLLLNRAQIAFGAPDTALSEDAIRRTFGHVGHHHSIAAGHTHD